MFEAYWREGYGLEARPPIPADDQDDAPGDPTIMWDPPAAQAIYKQIQYVSAIQEDVLVVNNNSHHFHKK